MATTRFSSCPAVLSLGLRRNCRRKAGAFAAAWLLAALGASAGAAQAPAASGAMFRGDAARTGLFGEARPAAIDHVRWVFKTGGRVLSSPVCIGDTCYIGSNDHYLYAIAVATGQLRWKFATGANVNGSPAVAQGRVHFLGLDGNAYALDARDGHLLWKFATLGESRLEAAGLYGGAPSREIVPDAWDFFLSSPLVADGVVYFGSGDHHVYALDAGSGRVRWKFRAGDVVHSSPALDHGLLYVGCWDGALYALDAASGRLAWKFATGTDATHFMQGLPASPAVADGVLVIGSRDNRIYGVEAASGRRLWAQENAGSWVIASAAIDRGTVYVTTSDSRKFRALDLHSGAINFELAFDAYSFSSPAVAGGHAYFGTFDGWFYDVDLASRRIAGRFQVPAGRAHPEYLSADGRLNMAALYGPLDADGNGNNTVDTAIVAVDRMLQLGSVLSSPAVVDGLVVFGSADGSVYALD